MDPNDNAKENEKDSNESLPDPGQGAVWMRPNQFIKGPQLFVGEVDPTSIIQGNLEDCYLLSAISVLARSTPQQLRSLFIVDEYNEFGLYGMCFYCDGEWRTVFIDDQLPIDSKTSKLVFAHCVDERELWVPVLEKCYAKLYSGYHRIIGGLVHESLKDLTGGAADEVSLENNKFIEVLWKQLSTYHKEGYLMGCGNPKPHSGNFEVSNGIVQGHAYAILNLKEAEGIRLIQLRNPWGDTEWEGDWGDESALWTQKYRELFHHHSDSSDGVFWMAFSDFVVQFQRVYLCRIFDAVIDIPLNNGSKQPILQAEIKNPWYRVMVDDEWRGDTAAGGPKFISEGGLPENNPQYTIQSASKAALAFVTLTQRAKTSQGSEYVHAVLVVCDKNGKRVRTVKKQQLVAGEMKFKNNREISVELEMEAGKIYTIFPATYKPGTEAPFTLTCYSRSLLNMTKLDKKVDCD